jgi:integrase
MALTVKKVEKLTRAGLPAKITDGGSDGVKGLMLIVESRSSAAWLLRYQRNKKTHHMGLGSARDLSVAAARELARRERERLAGGVDPLMLRKSERAAAAAAAARRLTFKEASERYFAAHEAGWSNDRHRDEFLSSLVRWVYPHIGGMDVAAVGKDEVLRVLEQKHPKLKGGTFWTRRTVTADRTRNRIERVLDFASARGIRAADTPNPARWKGFLDNLLPRPSKVRPVTNLRALPYAEVPDLMAKLAADEGVAAMAARFVILTACRIGEALGATWGEVDLDKAEWSVPAERMKARRPHTVPLSPQAMALLDQLPREQGNVFLFISSKTVGKALTEITVTRALRHAGCDATLHGFRSSFSTWAHERSAFSDHVIELSLAHSVGTAVSRAYRRTNLPEQRRRLMEQWAKFCCSPTAAKAGDVVPMRKA